jgi:acyl-CoA synthetase (NDP forming)
MLSVHAQELGVYFSKMISFGNARGLQAIDFLDYLAQDPETDIIAIYLEGISDGSRFTQLVREVNRVKPVIVWKGGLTESGSRAVASHTGSLAGESRVWDAFYAQTGAIRVTSREEIVDVAMAFLRLEPPGGRRVLLVGGGGGNSVAMADVCSREGLEVPPLGEDTRRELNTFIRLAGNSARNPIDAFMLQDNVEVFGKGMELAAGDPAIDAVILDRFIHGDLFQDETDRTQRVEKVNEYIIESARENRFGKPMLVALNARGTDPGAASLAARFWQRCARAGVATYATQAAASRALSLFISYHEYQARHR